jgi:hypothetical protein
MNCTIFRSLVHGLRKRSPIQLRSTRVDLRPASGRVTVKAVRSRKGQGGWDLLREDVEQALRAIVPPLHRSPRKEIEENSDLDRVLRAIDSARDVSVGLSFVPKVIDLVATDLDRAAAQRVLIGAASRGLVELRPEGGLNRLSDADRRGHRTPAKHRAPRPPRIFAPLPSWSSWSSGRPGPARRTSSPG